LDFDIEYKTVSCVTLPWDFLVGLLNWREKHGPMSPLSQTPQNNLWSQGRKGNKGLVIGLKGFCSTRGSHPSRLPKEAGKYGCIDKGGKSKRAGRGPTIQKGK
jgi:hypothetical protein